MVQSGFNLTAIWNLQRRVSPGALSNLLKAEKPSTVDASQDSSFGSCLIVYDGIGDTKDLPG